MSENLNWLDRLKNSFDGFEPDVKSNWNAFESRLEGLSTSGGNTDLMRQVKSAQRFAIGASAVAAGLALWMASPWLIEMADEIQAEDGVGSVEEVVMDQEGALEKSMEVSTEGNNEVVVAWQRAASNSITEATVTNTIKLDPSLAVESNGPWNGVESSTMGARTSTTFVLNLPETTVRGKANEVRKRDYNPESLKGSEVRDLVNKSDQANSVLATKVEANVERIESITNTESDGGPMNEENWTDFNVSVQEACAGTAVSFALNGLEREGSVLWNFGDGGFSQDVAPTHVYDNAGTYDITVSVRAPGDGTIRTRTVENMIVVRPKPEARMRWEFPLANPNRATVKLLDETEGASSSTWIVEQEDILKSEVMLDVPGEYHVNLVASNAFGCQDVAVDNIKLGSRKEAIAPALFSPNGDGRYDVFMPLVVMEFEGNWSLSVWDGNAMIFESSDEHEPWDGSLLQGGQARVGKKYVWKLETLSVEGERNLYVDEVLIDG